MATTAQEIALMKKDIETLKEDVKEINDKLDRLMVKLLDPDEGLVVRVNKNTDRLDERDIELPMWLRNLEQFKQMQRWKSNVTKALWGLYFAVIGYIVKLIGYLYVDNKTTLTSHIKVLQEEVITLRDDYKKLNDKFIETLKNIR